MPRTPRRSESVDDFLKAVYTLQRNGGTEGGRVSTNDLSAELGIAASSVTVMAQRLEQSGMVDYQRYAGVVLTPEGEAQALKVIRRHRLIESYLVQELGYALHEIHDEAERLEHTVSERFIEAIARKLEDTAYDPHGDPIPTADGTLAPRRDLLRLTELPLGQLAQVARFDAEDNAMLQYVLDRGFSLHTRLTVTAREPFDGPLTVEIGDNATQTIGARAAAIIFVQI